MNWLNWPNIIRATSLSVLVALGIADYGFDALAKPVPREVYLLLIAVALGIDIKALRAAVLRLLSGGGKS